MADKTQADVRRYRWTVTIDVDPSWVADGFGGDDSELALIELLQERLIPYAADGEVVARVVGRPDEVDILREQGYIVPPAAVRG